MLEDYAEVDKALADLNGNTQAFRLSEDRAHIEGMNQAMATKLFYGNEALQPEAFTGLSPRYNAKSGAENACNILPAAVADNTDNASIWLIVWGPNTICGIYPKGSKAGLYVEDKGQVTIENVDGAGGRMEAYRTHYRWDFGLHVKDWRYAVRLNFDLEDCVASGATGPVLNNLMSQAMRRIPSLSMGRPAFYMNRDCLDMLDLQSMNGAKMQYQTIENAQGKFVNYYRGVPIRRVDALLSTEAGIS
jgi:hypothetical protein